VARPTNGVGVDQQPASDLAAKRAGRPAARRRYVPVAAKFVVVVDNGSTDGTRAVAEAYGAATGLRVRCIEERRPGAIGEGIVLTWRLMRQGARVYYEPSAVAFTAAPTRLVHLARQRARWARGMIEGIRSVKPWSQPRWLLRFLTAIDLLIPALDVAYALVWLPGLALAATGRYWIVGPYTLAVLPLTLAVNLILYRVLGYDQELLGLRRRWK